MSRERGRRDALAETGEAAGILGEKAANAHRRERLLSAVGVNWRGALTRCCWKGSPNGTLS